MAKFKKGDRVRNVEPDSINTSVENYKFGDLGTVVDDDPLTLMPDILWDNGVKDCQYEGLLELLTEPSYPTPEMGPVEGTVEYWRFLFAGQAMQGILANGEFLKSHKDVNVEQTAIKYADALISELKKKGGEK